MKFNYIDVPYQWKDEFTKYPHGYTIFEALCSWTKQVDNMIDSQNKWEDYLDNFVENFEFELQEEVQSTIERWQSEGLLDGIIESALNTELDNVKTQLAENVQELDNVKTQLAENVQELDNVKTQLAENEEKINKKLNKRVLYASNYVNSNANFFNETDGRWYQDETFSTLATFNTNELQTLFDDALEIRAKEVVIDIDRILLDSRVNCYLDNATVTFYGEIVVDDGGSLLSGQYIAFEGENLTVNNLMIDGYRDYNEEHTSRGMQANFSVGHRTKNIVFNGGYSKNALQNHCFIYGENPIFNDFEFDGSGEHGIYATNVDDNPKERFTMKRCKVLNWGLSQWESAGASFRDYKNGLFEDCIFDGKGNANATYNIQAMENYRVTQDGDVKIVVRNTDLLGASIALWSSYHISIMEDCTTDNTPFLRSTRVKNSILRNVKVLANVYSYPRPAHVHVGCEINDPFQWRPERDSKWIDCTWISNQYSTDTSGGNGTLLDLGYSETDVQHDFINCTFKDMMSATFGLIRSRSKKNLFSGLTFINCGDTRAIECGAGTTVVLCRDIDNTGVRLRDPENAYLIANNNLSGYEGL